MNRMRNYFGGNSQGGGFSNMPGPMGNFTNVFNKFKEFMSNPMSVFMSNGINVPQNIQNNPEAITNYLRSSGVMSEDQFNQASQMANWAQNMFGKKF